MDRLLGQTLGRYRIESQLGRGGMATVYRAVDPAFDRVVAVKVLDRARAGDLQFAERFAREARAIARLEHPHIIPVYDFGQHDGAAYIVMKYAEGGSLKERLGRPFDVATAEATLRPIAAALDYAHGQGVLHRDVKPQNLLLDRGARPLLSDFGIAKAAQEAPGELTNHGLVIGTPEYMSPEQARGAPLDQRSDLYSLGVVLYEMLTGRAPFRAETPSDTPLSIAVRHATAPPSPRALNPALSPAVEAVLTRALAKEPAARYPSATALLDALHEADAAGATGGHETRPLAGTADLPTMVLPTTPSPPPPAGGTSSPPPTWDAPTSILRLPPAQAAAPDPPPAPRVAPAGAVEAPAPPPRAAEGSRRWPLLAATGLLLLLLVGGALALARAGGLGGLLPGQARDDPAPAAGAGAGAAVSAQPTSTPASAAPAPAQPTATTAPAQPTTAPTRVEAQPTATPARAQVQPPATTTIAPAQPTATPARAAGRVTLGDFSPYALEGAYRRDDGALYGRPEVALYGEGSGFSAGTYTFRLAVAPEGRVALVLTGLDDERGAHCTFQVLVNDAVIFDGPNTFPNVPAGDNGVGGQDRYWGQMRLAVPAGALKPGANRLTLRNTTPWEGYLGLPYVLINSAELRGE